jgi:hypothetical protein
LFLLLPLHHFFSFHRHCHHTTQLALYVTTMNDECRVTLSFSPSRPSSPMTDVYLLHRHLLFLADSTGWQGITKNFGKISHIFLGPLPIHCRLS